MNMANRGRRSKLTTENYLKTVRRYKTMSDKVISESLGLDRSTVFRYKNNIKNKETIDKARAMLESKALTNFNSNNVSYEGYLELPCIIEWKEALRKNEVTKSYEDQRIRGLYNLCVYLKTHPENLGIDQVADLIYEMKQLKKRELKENLKRGSLVPKGLSYSGQRVNIRSFFTLVLGISGELLANKGVDMAETEGAGKHSKSKITKPQRRLLEKKLKNILIKRDYKGECTNYEGYLEAITFCKFGYYSGSRKTGMLQGATFNNPNNTFENDVWIIEVHDKGKKGGLDWDKVFTGKSLDMLRNYVSKRFNIPIEDVTARIPTINSPLFPYWSKGNRGDLLARYIKKALLECGIDCEIPTHIFRHTFAQDFLEASGGNYEMCATLGGWKETKILKKHYGEMSSRMKVIALRKSMNLPVEDIQEKVLEW